MTGAVLRAGIALLLAASLAGACAPPAEPEEVRIGIRHSAFHPERLTVRAGDTVTFVVENADPIAHEFILGDDAVQRRHERGNEPSHGAVPGEVSVPAGATRSTTFTFTEPGTLVFACHLPGHFAYGMRGEVAVST